jgi:hypothetical protein
MWPPSSKVGFKKRKGYKKKKRIAKKATMENEVLNKLFLLYNIYL